jgi:hypothetical protein
MVPAMRRWKLLVGLTLLGIIVGGAVLFTGVYFRSSSVCCPNCKATRRALFLSSDQRSLLEMRAEQKMWPRVIAFRERGGVQGRKPEDWTEEDREVIAYTKHTWTGDEKGRLAFVNERVAELEAKLGKDALRCPSCKVADLEKDPLDPPLWPR